MTDWHHFEVTCYLESGCGRTWPDVPYKAAARMAAYHSTSRAAQAALLSSQ